MLPSKAFRSSFVRPSARSLRFFNTLMLTLYVIGGHSFISYSSEVNVRSRSLIISLTGHHDVREIQARELRYTHFGVVTYPKRAILFHISTHVRRKYDRLITFSFSRDARRMEARRMYHRDTAGRQSGTVTLTADAVSAEALSTCEVLVPFPQAAKHVFIVM